MKQNINPELQNLIDWLQANELAVSGFLPEKLIRHSVLDRAAIIDNMVLAIKVGNLNAIELGCDLVIQNKHIPFGKILKCNIFSALKPESRYINEYYRQGLAELAVKYLNAAYPAKELKPLCKLLRQFESKYSKYVINNVSSETAEAQRWVSYLEG